MFRGTVFTNGNLNNVRLTKSDLINANLEHCELNGIKLGQYPSLNIEN